MADLKMCPTREQGMISRTPPHIHTLRDSSVTHSSKFVGFGEKILDLQKIFVCRFF